MGIGLIEIWKGYVNSVPNQLTAHTTKNGHDVILDAYFSTKSRSQIPGPKFFYTPAKALPEWDIRQNLQNSQELYLTWRWSPLLSACSLGVLSIPWHVPCAFLKMARHCRSASSNRAPMVVASAAGGYWASLDWRQSASGDNDCQIGGPVSHSRLLLWLLWNLHLRLKLFCNLFCLFCCFFWFVIFFQFPFSIGTISKIVPLTTRGLKERFMKLTKILRDRIPGIDQRWHMSRKTAAIPGILFQSRWPESTNFSAEKLINSAKVYEKFSIRFRFPIRCIRNNWERMIESCPET
jgi:hypothetical protein